jgi:serine/threonine protein kinase
LSSKFPFDGHKAKEIFDKIKKGTYDMPKAISKDAKNLIKRMITKDPRARITTSNILSHPWIVKNTSKDKSL